VCVCVYVCVCVCMCVCACHWLSANDMHTAKETSYNGSCEIVAICRYLTLLTLIPSLLDLGIM